MTNLMKKIAAALGFALILPASLNIGIAIDAMISAVRSRFSTEESGSFGQYGAPMASGLVAGEAMVDAILLPALAAVMDLLK